MNVYVCVCMHAQAIGAYKTNEGNNVKSRIYCHLANQSTNPPTNQ